jgi:hypothetical protein
MARALITPTLIKKAEAATVAVNTGGGRIIRCTTGGAYIKCTGIDATKLILIVERSSASTGTGVVTIVAGTTGSATEPYSGACIGNNAINITSSTGTVRNRRVIGPLETARYKDTNQYIKLNYSTNLSTKVATSKAAWVQAILLP